MSDDNDDNYTCVRCGDVGQDRRTLWMACWYQMKETGVPFGKMAVHGQVLKHLGTEPYMIEGLGRQWDTDVWEEPKPDAPPHTHDFYTLRVCKDCRAEWMLAIQNWFQAPAGSLVNQEAQRKAAQLGLITIDGETPVRVMGATISVPQQEG